MIVPAKLLKAKQMKTKKGNDVGRFSVDFEVSNFRDKVAADMGALDPARIRRTYLRVWWIRGLVSLCSRKRLPKI